MHLRRQNGAPIPQKWCMAAADVVHQAPCGELLRDALALAHGLALALNSVGVIDDPVTDGISQSGIVQVLVPLAGWSDTIKPYTQVV